ncbi:MAG: glycerol-3-phosphate acyltransferase [Candidatus Kapabacteria bacterium]|nr:glycerol-3-phosphate acyltransferase [Ignavibacteriota bacterium]MCW5884344.1 glycerol-3-phosphate acyltransferase [Candidatus Kapabacteria bacterium]
MELLLSIVVSYLIGTIPSSYIIVKLFGKKDIFEHGSGNPGALNSFETTGSRAIGISVLILDLVKGVAAAILAYYLSGGFYIPFMAGLVWVIIGNNYNIFFGGKGGRGLAVAAGAFGAVSPYFVVTWLVMWLAGYYIVRKNVHIANGIALIGAMILVFSTPDAMYELFSFFPVTDYLALKITFSLGCFVILIRHFKPLRELAQSDNKEEK